MSVQYDKFTSTDRNLVLQELEKIQKTKLTQIKPSRKLFVDDSGLPYFIFGGKDDWHGITEKSMNRLLQYKREGAFVIVKKYKSKLEINAGSLSVFISNVNKLPRTQSGNYQFHCIKTENGLYLLEIPNLECNKIAEIQIGSGQKDLSRLKEISKIINIEVSDDTPLTHSDIQAKLLLVGSYLNYRTYTPDKSKQSIYGILGDLCSEKEIPAGSIPTMSLDTAKYIDVIWFDDEGFPTHAFEVEHTTDITKGLLRLYQIHKLHIKMYIIAENTNKDKFQKEIQKSPFHKIRNEYIFKNYQELDEFFESVKSFAKIQERFLSREEVA